MLERDHWLISPWETVAQRGDRERFIVDPDSRAPLGEARLLPPAPSVWPWRRTARIEIRETQDSSHVCTLVRSWWRRMRWNVYDADDAHVGNISGGRLRDPWGRSHGRLDAGGNLRDAEEQLLATLTHEAGAVRVDIADPKANPFWKMMLLALAVLHDPHAEEGRPSSGVP